MHLGAHPTVHSRHPGWRRMCPCVGRCRSASVAAASCCASRHAISSVFWTRSLPSVHTIHLHRPPHQPPPQPFAPEPPRTSFSRCWLTAGMRAPLQPPTGQHGRREVVETAKRWWDPGSARNWLQAVVLGAARGVAKMAAVVGAPQSMEKIPSWPMPARWCDAIGARLAALALPPSPPLLQSAMLRTAHRQHSARHSANRACCATPRSKSPLAFSKVIAAGMATCGPGAGCALRPYGSLHGNATHAAAAHAPSMTRNRQRCSGRCARCRRWASAGCVARGANKSLMAYGV